MGECRFQTGFREADSAEPGLVQEDDGTIWIVSPDGTREQLAGGGGGGGGGGAPSGPAGGVLGGTYPDPDFAVAMATQADLDAHAVDATAVHGITDTARLLALSADERITLAGGAHTRTVVGRNSAYAQLPDVANDSGELEIVGQDGVTVLWFNDLGDAILEAPTGVAAFKFRSRHGGAGTVDTELDLTNAGLSIFSDDTGPTNPAVIGFPNVMIRKVNPTAPYLGFYDSNFSSVPFFSVDKGGRPGLAVHSAPADGDIANGQAFLWFDQTNGAPKLKVKAKQANGTVVAGELALA